jgi:hypothetical protein
MGEIRARSPIAKAALLYGMMDKDKIWDEI